MEPVVSLRFYAELNDHLARLVPREAEVVVVGGESVGELIEASAVPLDEVDLVLVNGESVPFTHSVTPGDRVAVYPVFESFDVSPLVRARPGPLRVTRFLVDTGLEDLARLLSERGFDTALARDRSDISLVEAGPAEGRIILTVDPVVAASPGVTHVYLVRADQPDDQLAEVVGRLQLEAPM